ncbi:NAD(P)-dependent oxidoreductase [Pseudonocardia endophytica]|uniref:3-hydroxyisobutyrate dehydrogenase-like beta-hydroxyacid dehydrogenase n=1 Tax=Pseudonocardia endophytica TaxID=401976 RepID=A0A4R1HLE6_PSEEN|nr:NAD(P)-binding domain-containing protein [Pseudonocardia endophytica]TCK21921.1 3-hydroxyisobutyrate dehydrogenase-like beta-hydroxyacid dehydrogenase [Pseudonocardia endophytica]
MTGSELSPHTHDVTVIGCGLMGAGLARQFAKSGFRVVAWNRTHERAEALAGDGVTPVRAVVDAVRAAPLVVSCTSTYDTTRSALDPVDQWHGTTLVNLANGTPDEADAFERWARARGARTLEGGIFCYPQDLGSAEATIYYSGPAMLWTEHERTLTVLAGSSRHVSEQTRTANVMFVGISAFFIPAMSAYVEAATYLLDQGVSPDTLREITVPPLRTITYTTEETTEAITTGRYDSDQATVALYAETSAICLDAVRAAGHRARLLAAAVENLDRAEAAGLGGLGFYAQAKTARDPGTTDTH